MPFYQYICKSCNDDMVYDIWKSITDETLEYCPKCKGELSRMLGSAIVEFKGGGWAKDSYNKPKPVKVSEAKNE